MREKISSEQQFYGGNFLFLSCCGQRRMVRLLKAERKVTVTQVTTRYSQGIQMNIDKYTIKQTDNSSSRPHWDPCSQLNPKTEATNLTGSLELDVISNLPLT